MAQCLVVRGLYPSSTAAVRLAWAVVSWGYGVDRPSDSNLWVPKTSFISRGLGILMDQPAESIQPHNPFAGCWIGFGDGSDGGV